MIDGRAPVSKEGTGPPVGGRAERRPSVLPPARGLRPGSPCSRGTKVPSAWGPESGNWLLASQRAQACEQEGDGCSSTVCARGLHRRRGSGERTQHPQRQPRRRRTRLVGAEGSERLTSCSCCPDLAGYLSPTGLTPSPDMRLLSPRLAWLEPWGQSMAPRARPAAPTRTQAGSQPSRPSGLRRVHAWPTGHQASSLHRFLPSSGAEGTLGRRPGERWGRLGTGQEQVGGPERGAAGLLLPIRGALSPEHLLVYHPLVQKQPLLPHVTGHVELEGREKTRAWSGGSLFREPGLPSTVAPVWARPGQGPAGGWPCAHMRVRADSKEAPGWLQGLPKEPLPTQASWQELRGRVVCLCEVRGLCPLVPPSWAPSLPDPPLCHHA